MPRPTPADIGLVLLAAAVVAGAVQVATQDPQPPQSVALGTPADPTADPTPTRTPTASPTATPTPTAGTTQPVPTEGPVLLVGADLATLAGPLTALGWEVLPGEAGEDAVLADGALEDLAGIPVLVVLQVDAGTRTSERVATAVEEVGAAFPDARITLVGPFDPEATRTTQAVEAAAVAEGVLFLDPVAQGWTEGTDAEQVAEQLAAALAAANTPGG